jgi:ribulose-5-phosphate 4-epimerase/fuculose-1-phosphate aldolase
MSVHELDRLHDGATPSDAEIWQLRVDVAAACRLAALFGWDDQLATHITVRLPGEGHRFFINPFGMYFEEVTASSILEIDENGNAVSGAPVNLAGFMVHSAIHMNRPDARAVVHLHTIAGIAVGCSPRGLRNLSPYSMLVQPVAYHDWEGVVVDESERARLASDIGSSVALMLRNHGTLTVGETMGQAFHRIYQLQRACELQLAALTQGDDLIEMTQEMTERVQGQVGSKFGKAIAMNWDALLRKLDRIDPSYRD